MANPVTFPGDIQCTQGQGTFQSLYVQNAFITDRIVTQTAGPGTYIQATKLTQQWQKSYSNTDAGTAAVSEQRMIHLVFGATGTLVDFRAGAVVVLTGNDTCTIDLLKNGTTMLSAAIALASTDAAYAKKVATLNVTSMAVGDVIEVKVTATHNTGTLPKGVFAQMTSREDPQ